jgi:hypothetical protein
MESVLTFSEFYDEIVIEVKGGILLTDAVQCVLGDTERYTDVL